MYMGIAGRQRQRHMQLPLHQATHNGVSWTPCRSGVPKVVCMMKCRLGNQLHQLWIAQLVRELLVRPLHVVMMSTTEGFDLLASGLLERRFNHTSERRSDNGVRPPPNDVNPFLEVVKNAELARTHDVTIDVHAEDMSLIAEHEAYIRDLYRFRVPPEKQDRVLIHLRLGDVASYVSGNSGYVTYCLQTLRAIIIAAAKSPKPNKEKLPTVVIASEQPAHAYTSLLQAAIAQALGVDAVVLSDADPCSDFLRIAASSHIIMTNSTFSFWAAFLADPRSTRVFVGVSETQPCAFRNRTLFAKGCPANFQVTNIDLIPASMPVMASLSLPAAIRVPHKCLLTLTSAGYLDMTVNMLKSLLRVGSQVPVLVACQDDEVFRALEARRADLPNCTPLRSTSKSTKCASTISPAAISPAVSAVSAGLQDATHKEQQVFGSQGFNRMAFCKLDFIAQVLQHAAGQVAYVDSDVVFLRDPVSSALLDPLPDGIDILFQCDERAQKGPAQGRAPGQGQGQVNPGSSCCSKVRCGDCKNLCAGVMVLRNNAKVHRYLHHSRLLGPTAAMQCPAGDQTYVNLARGMVSYDTLHTTEYPNGSFLPSAAHEACGFRAADAVLIHFNYLTGGSKRQTMKTLGYWYL